MRKDTRRFTVPKVCTDVVSHCEEHAKVYTKVPHKGLFKAPAPRGLFDENPDIRPFHQSHAHHSSLISQAGRGLQKVGAHTGVYKMVFSLQI